MFSPDRDAAREVAVALRESRVTLDLKDRERRCERVTRIHD